jgi:hypothetical protein
MQRHGLELSASSSAFAQPSLESAQSPPKILHRAHFEGRVHSDNADPKVDGVDASMGQVLGDRTAAAFVNAA